MRQDPVSSERTAFGAALWLLADGDVDGRLSERIRALASRHDSIPFPPHVTLLGGIDKDEAQVLAAAARLARVTPTLTLRLTTASVRAEYFRRLVLDAEPAQELRAARARAARALGMPEGGFEPHLSLLYGTAAVTAQDAGVELPLVLTCRELAVWRTAGPVSDWRPLGRMTLQPPGAS